MRIRTVSLLCLALSACNGRGSDMTLQTPAAVVASFQDVIAGCASPLTNAGEIDQRAIAASGWTLTSRRTRLELEARVLALDAYPALRAGEYEATDWQHLGRPEAMQLIRSDLVSAVRPMDHCFMWGRFSKGTRAVDSVIAGMRAHFNRHADRVGAIPRGGDFLTPRSDPQTTGYYWKMPQHDVYLSTSSDGLASIDVVAMPDRSKLDPYSSDRPENRLVILPADTAK